MTEKNFLTKTLTDTILSRRSFLKWSAALGGTAVLAGGINYGLKTVEAVAEAAATQGKWVPAACWHNCGGRCPNFAYVQDGVVLKQKTDDTHPDSPDFPQQRGCARGRSQRRQVFGADRLKYPMKRAHWAPGGGDKSLRGKDEWVRISWDEALDIVASETKRIKESYGNKSIMGSSSVLNAYGGGLTRWGVSSEGAWPLPGSLMAGSISAGANDRLDTRNAKLVVFWGNNPIWSKAGNPTYNWMQVKKAGAKFIFVDPFFNDSAQVLADEWIPVRPGTDASLLLAIAYHMITNNLQDQEFLDKYTVGFDASHMPEGVNSKENFKDYVLGTYDGTPKTPEWASEICGTAPQTIRHFAVEIATTKPMMFLSSYSAARTFLGQQYCQAFLTVGWMTGNVGVSGGAVSNSASCSGGSSLVRAGSSGLPAITNPLFPNGGPYGGYAFGRPFDTDFYGMAYEEEWDAILKGEYTATVRGKIPCNIQLLWYIRSGSGGNNLNQSAGINKGIEATRKVEFVVTNDIVLSTVSKYADVVLPATTLWEKEGSLWGLSGGEALYWADKVTDPLYEARTEDWMEYELAKRLGLNADEIFPLSEKQMLFNQVAGSTVIKDDASGYQPLVTITDQDIAEWGVEGQPQVGQITLNEWREKGVFQVQRTNKFGYIAGKAFRDDPTTNPARTASGKLEIHCQSLADTIAAYGFTKIAPIAQYQKPVEGYEDTFADFTGKVKGDFPLQLVTIHSARRSHSVFDNISQLREAFPQELVLNPMDAFERGIQMGDIAKVSSRHGLVIRPVGLDQRVMPGVVMLGEGAWVQKDEVTGIDLAGATNTLCGTNLSGQGEEPWNTTNVQVEKWVGETLEPDAKWPPRIPIKEA